jgi:phosphopantothenoylcysteine decarboxylase/phosphopantothenate--cysteine ligase
VSAHVLVGVGGGIAAYKTADVVRRLAKAGADVRVAPTAAALKFVGTATWEALSHHPVDVDVFARVDEVLHVELGDWADLVVVAPATADLLARAAAGRADDLLTASLLATGAPIAAAPAMHTRMWEHPATQANAATLVERGWHLLGPVSGPLTGADSGMGRLLDPAEIAERSLALLRPQDLRGRRIVVTAGGTHEDIDPVRFIGNRSSGRQGLAVAAAARARGAEVVLLAGDVDAPLPSGVDVVRVSGSADLQRALEAALPGADALIMVAAVCDYRPRSISGHKLKKDELGERTTLELEATPDLLAGVSRSPLRPPVLVGFAAETASGERLLDLARGKLVRKGCDLIVANDVSAGVFGTDRNTATIVAANGQTVSVDGTKAAVAERLLDEVAARLAVAGQTPAREENPIS